MDNDSVEMDINVKVAELFQDSKDSLLESTQATFKFMLDNNIPMQEHFEDDSMYRSDDWYLLFLLCLHETVSAYIAHTSDMTVIAILDAAYKTYHKTKERLEL